jgi:hypothetical protein
MGTTVVIAGLGLVGTLLGGWLGAYWQHRSTRDLHLLDAKVRVYGDCAASLYEYERVTYGRVNARLDARPEADREALRAEAYRNNSAARAAIGQLGILSSARETRDGLNAVRQRIADLNASASHTELKERHEAVYAELDRLLELARSDLTN